MTFQPSVTEAVAALAPREPITSLRFFGRALPPLVFPPVQRTFTIGTGGCDLVVPRSLSSLVEPLHATMDRACTGLRVRDHATAHGIFRALRGPRVCELQVEAGDVFWLADVPLLALDPHLESLRGRLASYVGLDRHIATDEAVEAIAEGRPLVLVGPRGMEAMRLARAIHDASAQRGNPFLLATEGSLPLLDLARGATVFVDLDAIRKLTAPYAARLFDASAGVRVVFAAAHERRARAYLDTPPRPDPQHRPLAADAPPIGGRAAACPRLA